MIIIDRIKSKINALRHKKRSSEEADEMVNRSIGKTIRNQQSRARKRSGRHGSRALALAVAVVLPLSGMVFTPASVAAADSFDTFMENEWLEYVETDYTSLHSSVKDYKAMGLKKPEVTFGEVSYEEIAKELKDAQKSLDKLHEFDYDSLNETQQHDYLVFEEYVECLIGMNKYPDMLELFRPVTGYMTQAKEYLEDFALYREEDLEDYLVLAKDYGRLIDQMIEFTSQQAKKGYLMDDNSLDDAISEINDFANAGESNEMIVVFNNNLDAIDWLSDSAKSEYEEKNKAIVLDTIIPAYQRASKALEGMRGSRQYGNRVCDYPDGEEYYSWFARYNCSTGETLQEKFDFITECITESLDYYRNFLQEHPDFEEDETIQDMESLDEVIDYLKGHLDGFPAGPDVNYRLAYLDESVSEDAMAYYIPSPVDDINENVIHVNKDSVNDINTLYFTLAHEGFPGHLYQMTWYQNSGGSKMRQELSIMGYQEGWANYVERIMLQKAPLDSVSAEDIACNEFISYMLNAGADIAVNGLGYDLKELSDWIKGFNLDQSFANDLYSYSIENPGLLLPYGYGMAKFWDLDGRARAALGNEFNSEEYHLQLLKNGPRQFELVEQDVRAYVESKGKTLPDDAVLFANESETEGQAAAPVQSEPDADVNTPDNTSKTVPFAKIAVPLLIALAVIVIILIRRASKKKSGSEETSGDTAADAADEAADEAAEETEVTEEDTEITEEQ